MTVSTRWVVGDVQGYLDPLKRVLASADLLDSDGAWTGGDATLYVLGDLVDRGPDGVGVIDLLMRLHSEGHARVVIGNHDILLMAARKFPSVVSNWQLSGGVQRDLDRLTDAHVAWLQSLPAALRVEDVLLLHADALFYLNYGSTLEDLNHHFGEILHSDEQSEWDRLLDDFAEHRAFLPPAGCENLDRMFDVFGGATLVHGHTPVPRVLRQPAETVTQPLIYCDGRCVNVDPGFYLGGSGFTYVF